MPKYTKYYDSHGNRIKLDTELLDWCAKNSPKVKARAETKHLHLAIICANIICATILFVNYRTIVNNLGILSTLLALVVIALSGSHGFVAWRRKRRKKNERSNKEYANAVRMR